MGSSKKKDKDRERTREEKAERAERKRKKREHRERERERDRDRSTRSRSRDRERDKEKRSHRHRHKHKKHRKKRSREDRERSPERDRSHDREQSHDRDGSQSRSRSASLSNSELESLSDQAEFIEIKDDEVVAPPPPKMPRTASPPPPPPPPAISGDDGGRRGGAGAGGEISLSMEETNRLRAKLGLKPLAVDSGSRSGRGGGRSGEDYGGRSGEDYGGRSEDYGGRSGVDLGGRSRVDGGDFEGKSGEFGGRSVGGSDVHSGGRNVGLSSGDFGDRSGGGIEVHSGGRSGGVGGGDFGGRSGATGGIDSGGKSGGGGDDSGFRSGGGGGGAGGDISLSIEETNRLRAKLGLKPLSVDSVKKSAPEPKKENADEDVMEHDGVGVAVGVSTANQTVTVDGETFVHKPADNLADKLKVEKLREKIKANKEKRLIKSKLSKVKALGESDDEDFSAAAWVKRSRKLTKEKAEAEKRQKIMEELDEQFGIGDMVNQEITEQKEKKYSHRNLAGLKIQHDMETFNEGSSTILTLADSKILDDGAEDTLVNVNIVDDERAAINVENRKKKGDDVEYEAPEMDEFGNLVQKTVLTKYDEEIGGLKKKSFRIGFGGVAVRDDEERNQVNTSVQRIAKLRKLQALDVPRAQLASEYLTHEEMEMVSFKKPKKKKKKKKFRVDDLEPIEDEGAQHLGSRAERREMLEAQENGGDLEAQVNAGYPGERLKSLRELMEEDEPIKPENEEEMEVEETEQDDFELQEALARSRRAKLSKQTKPNNELLTAMLRQKLQQREMEEPDDDIEPEKKEDLNMTLNTTDEFCRTLGEIPTYGLSGNRVKEEMGKMQYSVPKTAPETEPRGAWEEVGIDDIRVEISDDRSAPILEEEPDAAKGVANALKLAMQKGYLEKDQRKGAANAALQHLRAVHYSIEDKTVDDDRGRRGGGHDRYSGPLTDFVDKELYRPEVRLEYVDDEGRKLNSKEAFRYLSHKFHGKGSGKNKTEKRMKKWNEELLMKHMSSSDTPLQTLERQREKQKQLAAPYLILSGNKNQEAMDVKK